MNETTDIDTYILSHIDAEAYNLAEMNHEAHITMLNPRMSSGHLQGRLLSMIAHMIQPKRILELGTFIGYSALCMAEALSEKGILHTIESDDELEDLIRKNLATSMHGKKIQLHIGKALDIIPTLNEVFDMVFIDADKREYTDYYNAVFEKVRSGGYIVADNTLWNGKILEPVQRGDKQTAEIIRFNNYIATDKRIEKIIIPLRDGLTIIRKL